MALNPVNYLTDVANPYASAMQGYTQGTNLVAGIQQAEFDRQLAEQKRLAEQQKRADMQAFATLQNPTAKDYAAIMNQYPELSENYKRSWDILDKDQKQRTLSSSSQVYAALSSGQPLVAQQLLERQAEAALNSGDIETSKHLDALSQIVQQDPSLAQKQIGMFMSATSPDQFATITKTLGEEQRSNQLQPYEIAQKQAQTGLTQAQTNLAGAQTFKTTAEGQQAQYEAQNTPIKLQLANQLGQAQIDKIYADIDNQAQRLGIDRDKLTSDVELKLAELQQTGSKLSDGAQKIVNDSIIASSSASSSASSLNDLANRLDSAGGGYGAFSRASEWLKNATGNQGAMTSLRQEYTRMRNSEAIKMLPPGPATDKDIELVMQGFPKDTADSREIASFLRGMAKLNQRTAVMEEAKAEWTNMNGSMGSNKRDIEVLGVRVPQGTTFNNFVSKNFDSIQKQQGNQRVRQQVASGQRSYMQGQ